QPKKVSLPGRDPQKDDPSKSTSPGPPRPTPPAPRSAARLRFQEWNCSQPDSATAATIDQAFRLRLPYPLKPRKRSKPSFLFTTHLPLFSVATPKREAPHPNL